MKKHYKTSKQSGGAAANVNIDTQFQQNIANMKQEQNLTTLHKKYRKLALLHHPDRGKNNTNKTARTTRMTKISEVYTKRKNNIEKQNDPWWLTFIPSPNVDENLITLESVKFFDQLREIYVRIYNYYLQYPDMENFSEIIRKLERKYKELSNKVKKYSIYDVGPTFNRQWWLNFKPKGTFTTDFKIMQYSRYTDQLYVIYYILFKFYSSDPSNKEYLETLNDEYDKLALQLPYSEFYMKPASRPPWNNFIQKRHFDTNLKIMLESKYKDELYFIYNKLYTFYSSDPSSNKEYLETLTDEYNKLSLQLPYSEFYVF